MQKKKSTLEGIMNTATQEYSRLGLLDKIVSYSKDNRILFHKSVLIDFNSPENNPIKAYIKVTENLATSNFEHYPKLEKLIIPAHNQLENCYNQQLITRNDYLQIKQNFKESLPLIKELNFTATDTAILLITLDLRRIALTEATFDLNIKENEILFNKINGIKNSYFQNKISSHEFIEIIEQYYAKNFLATRDNSSVKAIYDRLDDFHINEVLNAN